MLQIHRWMLLFTGSMLLAGCASPWEQNFQPNPMLDAKFPPTERVELREVEFARLENYEKAEQKP